MAHENWHIGELADAEGLNPRTIRYYERIGLLPPARRSQAGYRLYGATELEQLRFIRKAQAVGFTLREIATILAVRRSGQAPCQHVVALLDEKLARVERQLRALAELRGHLQQLRAAGAGLTTCEAPVCTIIEGELPTAVAYRTAHGAARRQLRNRHSPAPNPLHTTRTEAARG